MGDVEYRASHVKTNDVTNEIDIDIENEIVVEIKNVKMSKCLYVSAR